MSAGPSVQAKKVNSFENEITKKISDWFANPDNNQLYFDPMSKPERYIM